MAPRIDRKSFLLTSAVLIILAQLCQAAPNIRGVQFDVYLGAMSDTGNVVGYRGDASEEYDAGVDLPEPPAPLGGYLLLYIDAMEGAPESFTRFRTDYRSISPLPMDSTRNWTLNISTDQTSDTVVLKATLGTLLDANLPLYLFDGDRYHNLREVDTLQYSAAGNSIKTFRLIAGEPGEPEVTITLPGVNSQLPPSASQEFTWSANSAVSFVRSLATVSVDGGANWATVVDDDSLLTAINWTTPDSAVSAGRFRVSLTDSLDRVAEDEIGFTVAAAPDTLEGVEILSPLAGDLVDGADTVTVDWRWLGGVENLSGSALEVSYNGGASWSSVASFVDTTSHYDWPVPDNLYTENAQLRVTASVASATGFADSVSGLTICPTVMNNLSFEEWSLYGPVDGPPDDWAISGSSYGSGFSVKANLTAALHVDGNMSAQVDLNSGKTMHMVQRCQGAVPGVAYSAQLRVLDQAAAGSVQISLSALDASGGLLTSNASATSVDESGFQTISTSLTAPNGSTYLRMDIQLDAALTSTFYLDDLQIVGLEPTPEVVFISPVRDTALAVDGSSSIEVGWSYNGTKDLIAEAFLEATVDGTSWLPVAEFADGTDTTFNWTGVDTLALDAQLRLRAVNASALSDTAYSALVTLSPTERHVYLDIGWHLFALPLLPEDPSVAAVLGDDVTDTMLVYGWAMNSGYYTVDTLEAIRGYWLALTDASTLDIQGTTQLDTLRSALDLGWNLMLNPYPAPMTVAGLSFQREGVIYTFEEAVAAGMVSSPLYGYDPITRQYSQRGTSSSLPSMEAFWIWNFNEGVEIVFIPDRFQTSPASKRGTTITSSDSLSNWTASLLLRSTRGVSRLAEFGFDPGASSGIDPGIDTPAPPDDPEGEMPRLLWISEEESALLGFHLIRDLRSPFSGPDSVREWRAVIHPGNEDRLDIDVSEAVAVLPDGVSLEWVYGGAVVDAREEPLVRWHRDVDSDTMVVRMTFASGTEGQTTPLPSSFQVQSVYPNPFNGQLQILFGLSREEVLTLDVFTIEGRRVYSRDLGSFGAGWHRATWKANAASGYYFIRIRTSHGEQEVRRVVLLR